MLCAEDTNINQMIITLQGDSPFHTNFGLCGPKEGIEIMAYLTLKMLGVLPYNE